jgi:hypothetical protein
MNDCGTPGDVELEIALAVIQAHGVEVTIAGNEEYRMEQEERIYIFSLGQEPLRRNMVQSIAKKFGIPVHLFYNPPQAVLDAAVPSMGMMLPRNPAAE